MISLVFALACAADDSVATGGSGSDDSDTGAPATEVTDTEGFNGTSPREPVPLPTFAALNQYGDPRGPEDLLGHATVIWFYPLADTPG